MAVGWQALIAGLLAGLTGLTELVSRYRSDPTYALRHSLAAWLYVGLNVASGVAALFLIRAFGWTFGQSQHVDLWRILVAGFGAVAFFRSSFFVAKVGGSNIGVGPSLVLGALLEAFDREVDRKSARKISTIVKSEKLAGLNPQSTMLALPVLCLALMQNFAPADQALLGTELVKTQNEASLTPEAKMRAVIISLAKYLGASLVESVLENAREIFEAPPPPPPPATPAPTLGAPVAGQAAPGSLWNAVVDQAKVLTQTGAEAPSPPTGEQAGDVADQGSTDDPPR